MKNLLIRIGLTSLLVSMMLAVGIGTRTDAAAAPPRATTAQVRIVHTALDIPPVGLVANNAQVLSEIQYKGISSLVSLPTGQQSLRLTLGEDAQSSINVPIKLESGQTYSLLVAGTKADVSVKVLQDDLSPVAAGQARVRAVHASPDTPAADVALQQGRVLFPNLAFTDSSSYRAIPAATVDVELRPAGSSKVVAAVPQLALEAGKVYTVYAVGLSSGSPPLSILPVVDVAGTAGATTTTGTGTGTGTGSGTTGTTGTTGAGSTGSLPQTGVPSSLWLLLVGAFVILLSGTMLRRLYR